jgi:hypothetical protein
MPVLEPDLGIGSIDAVGLLAAPALDLDLGLERPRIENR